MAPLANSSLRASKMNDFPLSPIDFLPHPHLDFYLHVSVPLFYTCLPCLEVSHLLPSPGILSRCQICCLYSFGSEAFSNTRLMLQFVVQEGF